MEVHELHLLSQVASRKRRNEREINIARYDSWFFRLFSKICLASCISIQKLFHLSLLILTTGNYPYRTEDRSYDNRHHRWDNRLLLLLSVYRSRSLDSWWLIASACTSRGNGFWYFNGDLSNKISMMIFFEFSLWTVSTYRWCNNDGWWIHISDCSRCRISLNVLSLDAYFDEFT
jgi:hypothetical protein